MSRAAHKGAVIQVVGRKDIRYRVVCACGWKWRGRGTSAEASAAFGKHVARVTKNGARPVPHERFSIAARRNELRDFKDGLGAPPVGRRNDNAVEA